MFTVLGAKIIPMADRYVRWRTRRASSWTTQVKFGEHHRDTITKFANIKGTRIASNPRLKASKIGESQIERAVVIQPPRDHAVTSVKSLANDKRWQFVAKFGSQATGRTTRHHVYQNKQKVWILVSGEKFKQKLLSKKNIWNTIKIQLKIQSKLIA